MSNLDNWEFKVVKEEGFEVIPEGTHRVRIESADMTTSQSGRDMITIKLAVSNYRSQVWDHIVFLPDNPELTNKKLTKLFNAFGIDTTTPAYKDLKTWVGKTGGCVLKVDEFNGKPNNKVHYYITPEETSKLPAWVDKRNTNTTTTKIEIKPDDLPF